MVVILGILNTFITKQVIIDRESNRCTFMDSDGKALATKVCMLHLVIKVMAHTHDPKMGRQMIRFFFAC